MARSPLTFGRGQRGSAVSGLAIVADKRSASVSIPTTRTHTYANGFKEVLRCSTETLVCPDRGKRLHSAKGKYPETSCNMLIALQEGRATAHGCYTSKQKPKQRSKTPPKKLSMEIRQTGGYKPSRGKRSRFSSSLGGHTRFVSPSPLRHLSFCLWRWVRGGGVLIAVYRERVITCETGRVIFLPRV